MVEHKLGRKKYLLTSIYIWNQQEKKEDIQKLKFMPRIENIYWYNRMWGRILAFFSSSIHQINGIEWARKIWHTPLYLINWLSDWLSGFSCIWVQQTFQSNSSSIEHCFMHFSNQLFLNLTNLTNLTLW